MSGAPVALGHKDCCFCLGVQEGAARGSEVPWKDARSSLLAEPIQFSARGSEAERPSQFLSGGEGLITIECWRRRKTAAEYSRRASISVTKTQVWLQGEGMVMVRSDHKVMGGAGTKS
jgi:hypothetical protein